ncbi:hypothetical protein JNB11_07505 [Kocuria palustris]|nr:hypothetical protein [Kocuria palustris]
MELDQVKHTIKQWERLFLKKNGRPPLKKDVRSDPTVRLLYQTYNELKHGKPSKHEQTGTPHKLQPVLLPDEIGPTPQANGRVLSIFDHHLTPPASLPSNPFGSPSMTTPTKSSTTTITTTQVSTSGSLMDKLLAVASPQKSSPIKHLAFSPVKTLRTPTKPTVAFSATPSPMKPQRLVGRLTKVFMEATSAPIPEIDDEDLLAATVAVEELLTEQSTTEESQPDRKKVKTQKRTTRNWKIKPRGVDEAPDTLAGKNLQEELRKLASQTQSVDTTSPTAKRKLELVREVRDSDDESSEEETEEPVVYKRPHVENGIAPMSYNFQRARINDPRIAKFKRRVRR